jgi:hypothetical protein
MNIKRIIREELSALSDSFYLLVSDDEKFIYGMGRFGGKSFEPVENFDAEAILRSRFKTEDDALEQISWAEYYEGGGGTPGEIADRMLKHNPKVVTVDFILRKRDESFPIIESNELDWIKNVDPLTGGEYYDDSKAICFGDEQKYCDVRITNEYITFYLDVEDFGKLWDEESYWEDDRWILESLWKYGTPYDGDDDWYEFDSDEFNYSYHRLYDDQKNRFNEILKTVGSDEVVQNFEDGMNSLINEFRHPKIQSMFDNMISEYLNQLGYVIQRNRWLDVSRQWDVVTKESNVELDMSNDEIEIEIPVEKAYQNYYNTSKVNDLTQLIKEIISNLSYTNWYEWFYDEWNTSGGDEQIDQTFNDFLDKAEDYIESEDFEKWEKVLSDFEELGIKNKDAYWYNYQQLVRENPNDDTIWVINLKGRYDKADLMLYKKHSSTYYGNQDVLEKHMDVPLEEIPKYIKPL